MMAAAAMPATQHGPANAAKLFASVFPTPALAYSTPTPVGTPDLGFTAPGQSFGGFGGPAHESPSATHSDIKKHLAWSIVTRFLSLQDEELRGGSGGKTNTREVTEALGFLLGLDGGAELMEWYTNEVRMHFERAVRSQLARVWELVQCRQAWEAIHKTVVHLSQVQLLYLQPLQEHIMPLLTAKSGVRQQNQLHPVARKFRRNIHAMFLHSLPSPRFQKALGYVLYDAGCTLFHVHVHNNGQTPSQSTQPNAETAAFSRNLQSLLVSMQDVGLGGDSAQRAFAHAMDKLMGTFIVSHYMKVDWYGRKSVVKQLKAWVSQGFAPLVRMVVKCLQEPGAAATEENTPGQGPLGGPGDVQQWQDMAIGRLGRARIDNLFDYIVNWDRSFGAILDIKEYLITPAARTHLTTTFSQQCSRRLLQHGATTQHILDVYIYTIHAFNELDSKGVLLDRIARPIRRYLREREDTARIIVSSLLADIEDEHGNRIDPGELVCAEIAAEMLNPITSNEHEHDEEVNWNDMNWTPDPSDASPDYKKSKSEDILSYLLSLYDKEEFINELKNILGEHLIRNEDAEFEKEIRLLELFKLRMGDDKLQACEVMLHDVLDSKRITNLIQKSQQTAPQRSQGTPALNAQILSSFFWPELRTDTFVPPAPIRSLQASYEKGFESLKDMRKLHWLPVLGRVTVELYFSDRVVNETVGPAFATVIYAFQSDPPDPKLQKTADELEDELQMDPALVRSALAFWTSKRVLRPLSRANPDTFVVIESLSDQGDATAAPAAPVAPQDTMSAVKSQDAVFAQNAPLYAQFVLGMLTNGGAMPAARMLMMLKIAIPGGFPFGEEELRELLTGMEGEGKVAQGAGDVWGIRKE